ncbi:hypothetical protein INT43_000105 [Umbelopsis isabellina]|uniref:Uncharacterized protein n=1 Tax=Mortierella isabellina TaxID=91625 RepID=A0A8H7PF39_MORIS|nr:hypothetical protein INT43_000105 [Umbelopsis isabellina]
MLASSNAVNDRSFSQVNQHQTSERCEVNESAESFNRKYPELLGDTSVRNQPQELAASHDALHNREFHNDYSQHFVDSGQRPQNYIRSTSLITRFNEYPKLQELIAAKDNLINAAAGNPWALKADLRKLDLQQLQCRFDVIIVDPPWEEYCRRSVATAFASQDIWTYSDVARLNIEAVAANPSFIWIWCGNAENVSRGRQLLVKWGYRRCEDLIWVKTNRNSKGSRIVSESEILQHSKEHCLMGIKGTVRRSTDGHFIHCNVDTDVIVSEEQPENDTRKPDELYHIIEHFCLGKRRLELFGEEHNLRPGWLTVGCDLPYSNFTSAAYKEQFLNGHLLRSTSRIEVLRPKSPPPRDPQRKQSVKKPYMSEVPLSQPPPHWPMIYPFPMPLPMPQVTMQSSMMYPP